MADIDSLINKRASIRGRLTKFSNYLAQVGTIVEESQFNELQLKTQKINELCQNYDLLQDKIDELCPETIDEEIDQRDATESQFTQLLAKAKTLLKQYADNNVQASSTQSDSRRSHEASFKLPTIVISKFDGNYSDWLEFRDTYKSLIHNNPQLLPIHKFHYLNSYLTGEAARLLTNLEVSSQTYNEAWDLLCERFNNKRHLIHNHLNALFNLESISRENDKSIRSLVDNVNKDLRALSSLGEPTDKWDTIIIHMVSMKLDHNTKRAWEELRNTFEDMPKLSQFTKFLQERASILETCNKRTNTTNMQQVSSKNVHAYRSLTCTTNSSVTPAHIKTQYKPQSTCTYCSKDHIVYNCPAFLAKTPEQRQAEVIKLHLCINCLKRGHNVKECRSSSCRQCRKRHHTLLHFSSQPAANVSVQTAVATAEDNPIIANIASSQPEIQVLLSTAVIEVVNPETNKKQKARCLLDSGSQATFITKSLKERLGLNVIPTKAVPIMGMSNTPRGFISERSVVRLQSTTGRFNVTQACAVIPELTENIPHRLINIKHFNIPANILLADPSFNTSSPVEIIIGADLFWQIIGSEERSLGPKLPMLRNSQLGWLITGPLYIDNELQRVDCHLVTNNTNDNSGDTLNYKLSRFWELEELPKRPLLSDSEKMCEAHFQEHTIREGNGRFCVRIPLKQPPNVLGDSYQLARRRFLSLERKFRKNPALKKAYCEFIEEYKNLGHCSETLDPPVGGHYLCHHAVLSDRSESTKLRVVFDGSAPTTSGVSINDIQFTGPKVQDALLSILLRFRTHKYVLAGDIDKFFRQVLMHEDDRNLQLILWREAPDQPLVTLKLNTVTYGFTSASYLSTKCLWMLGQDCSDPKIKEIIQNDFYCDDLLTGANTKEELIFILNAVISKLKSGCLNLRKFRSNAPEIFPKSTLDLQANLSLSDATSALGLGWSPPEDVLQFTIEAPTADTVSKSTKRSILSSSFSIFDPLGLLAPCTVQPKMLLQQLWKRGLDWDEPVPEDLQRAWHKIREGFPLLSDLTIPRRVLCDETNNIQLHSFSDASMHAYGACIFLRSINKDGDITVQLLCAKSRVAPTKPPLTIPKLELLGALLAANLSKLVLESLRCPVSKSVHWCDSRVALAWLNICPSKLKSFVANKVVEICENTNLSSWRYVPTASNPVDYISRGVSPEKLRKLQDWWTGPSFLAMEDTQWPVIEQTNNNNILHMKQTYLR
ncbi:uncharacterized protein LOC123723122 [Papilio machaon]|uniref:uncharacterized protein LOC123723122 n=1 Tax=Papilio machaon TaxID=76193 RepID=UPI001E665C61|nr:uncharacterized protein LOC123723122 [Papilio machaon]